MRRKLLLCISTFHLTAAVWSRGQLRAVQEFSDDEGGQREFLAFLAGLRRIPIYILTDTLDEDYRFEVLPHATGKDQAELVQRKLKQSYRNSPFCNARLLPRDPQNKREDRYVFAAITNTEVLDPWLNLVMARRIPVVGIYLAPMAINSLIHGLGFGQRNTLTVSQHSAGLRQTFYKLGQYRISRLTLARPNSIVPSAVDYAEEIRNTRGYLDALNVTHVDEAVTVLILDSDGTLADLETSLDSAGPSMQVVRLGPEQLAQRLGLPQDILRGHRDALPLQLLAGNTPEINLAPRAVTSGYNRMRASRAIYAAAGASLALTLSWVAVNVARSSSIDEESQSAMLLARGEEARYQEVARSFPAIPTTSVQLRETAEAAVKLRAAYRTPDLMFRVLAQALDAQPDIVLKSLQWKHEPVASPTVQDFTQSATVSAELLQTDADQRVTLARIDEFVRLLGKHPAVMQARATKYPVSGASTSAIVGDTAVKKAIDPVASVFEVGIVLKPGQ